MMFARTAPRKLFLMSGCLAGLSVLFGLGGVVLLILGLRDQRLASTPVDAPSVHTGEYDCSIKPGDTANVIRKFQIHDTTYDDLSFNQGSGDFTYDSSDQTITFSSGPFDKHFLGVYVPTGGAIKPSKRYQWGGSDPSLAEHDSIRLLDLNTSYSGKGELGVYCARADG